MRGWRPICRPRGESTVRRRGLRSLSVQLRRQYGLTWSAGARSARTADVIVPRPVHFDLLVVEDEPIIMKVLSRVAVKQRHPVTTSTDRLQAIELFHERAFNLIICDFDMNGVKGDTLVTMLRKRSPTTTLVIYTGNPTSVRDGGRDAADIVVSKPRDPQDVLTDSMRIARHRRENVS